MTNSDPRFSADIAEALHDLKSHRDVWRGAIKSHCTPFGSDDDGSYWDHELRAFDRTFDALAGLSGVPAQPKQVWPKEIRSLVNEIAGVWDAFEYGLRQEISNTNYAVVKEKLAAVESLLAARPPAAPVETCPNCGVSFDGGPIPEDIRHHYSPPYRWSRKIGMSSREEDRIVSWKCPDCGHEWSSDGGVESRHADICEVGHEPHRTASMSSGLEAPAAGVATGPSDSLSRSSADTAQEQIAAILRQHLKVGGHGAWEGSYHHVEGIDAAATALAAVLGGEPQSLGTAAHWKERHDAVLQKHIECCGQVGAATREALEIAEDVLSRAPFSTGIWPNGMHPNKGIEKIRAALSLTRPQSGGAA